MSTVSPELRYTLKQLVKSIEGTNKLVGMTVAVLTMFKGSTPTEDADLADSWTIRMIPPPGAAIGSREIRVTPLTDPMKAFKETTAASNAVAFVGFANGLSPGMLRV